MVVVVVVVVVVWRIQVCRLHKEDALVPCRHHAAVQPNANSTLHWT